jgi:hypothetical protein
MLESKELRVPASVGKAARKERLALQVHCSGGGAPMAVSGSLVDPFNLRPQARDTGWSKAAVGAACIIHFTGIFS